MKRLSPSQRYFLHRLYWYVATLLVAITLTFVLPRLGPVDPVDIIMANISTAGLTGDEVEEIRAEYRRAFHLDKPIIRQYLIYLGQTLRCDLGVSSINYPRKCWSIIRSALPWSLALVIPTVILAWILGNGLGALAAYKRGIFDKILYPVSLFMSSVPFFCFGLLLVFVLYTQLNLVDSLGAYSPNMMPSWSWAFLVDMLAHYWLPFLSIFLILVGGQAVGMRSMGIYELGTDYVRYSKGLGIRESKILIYVFRNAMLPQLTGLALMLGTMIGGTMITEIIFSYPGLGLMMLKAIHMNDYPLIQAIALLIAVTVLVLNFAVDVLVGFLDPRIKAGQETGGAR